jgi:hypothetical protein
MLRLIRGENAVGDAIRARVAEILQEVERNHELLGFHLQMDSVDVVSGCILYPIELEAPDLRHKVAALAGEWSVGLPNAIELIRELTAQVPAHDVMLAIAVILGAFRKWNAAAQYAALAIGECEAAHRSPHEARFFRSVSLHRSVDRHNAKAFPILREALQTLDTAKEERDAVLGLPDDPRYLYERAMLWSSLARFDASILAEPIIPTLREAWTLAAPGRLRDRILNTLVIHLAEVRDDKEARQWQEALARIPDPPPAILDTTIYTAFLLDGEQTEEGVLRHWVETLLTIASKTEVRQERVTILSHAEHIQATIGRRRES